MLGWLTALRPVSYTEAAAASAKLRCRGPRASSFSSANHASHLKLTPPSEEDLRVIKERQIGHELSNVIGCGGRCKHGYPQAFAFDPLSRAAWLGGRDRKSRIESGLFRLSCPLLVKAIDEWEAEGAVRLINEQMQRSCEDGQPRAAGFAEKLREAHAGHAAARQEIIGDQLPELLGQASAEGEKQLEVVQTILDSGIAGRKALDFEPTRPRACGVLLLPSVPNCKQVRDLRLLPAHRNGEQDGHQVRACTGGRSPVPLIEQCGGKHATSASRRARHQHPWRRAMQSPV